MTVFFRIFISFFVFLSTQNSFSADEEYSRNWRKSLNISIKNYSDTKSLKIDDWIKINENFISTNYRDENVQSLMSENIATCNLAIAQLKLFYNVVGSDKIHVVTLQASRGKVSLSGQKKFKDGLLVEHKRQILSGHSFDIDMEKAKSQSKSKVENGIRSDYFKRKINTIIGSEVVKEGGHSESYLILDLYKDIPNILRFISEKHESEKVNIVGTVLTIFSLKDPCEKSCLPMLSNFNKIILSSLKEHIEKFQEHISLAGNLERITLMVGKEPHFTTEHGVEKSTRGDYDSHKIEFNEKIVMDFEHPQSRVFSAIFNDLS